MQNTLENEFPPVVGVVVWVKESFAERQLTGVSDVVREWDDIGARLALRSETDTRVHAPLASLRITGRRLRVEEFGRFQEIACRVTFENDQGDPRESCAAVLRCPRGWTLVELKEKVASAQV